MEVTLLQLAEVFCPRPLYTKVAKRDFMWWIEKCELRCLLYVVYYSGVIFKYHDVVLSLMCMHMRFQLSEVFCEVKHLAAVLSVSSCFLMNVDLFLKNMVWFFYIVSVIYVVNLRALCKAVKIYESVLVFKLVWAIITVLDVLTDISMHGCRNTEVCAIMYSTSWHAC